MEYEAWNNKLLFCKSNDRKTYLQIYVYFIIWIDWKHLPYLRTALRHYAHLSYWKLKYRLFLKWI